METNLLIAQPSIGKIASVQIHRWMRIVKVGEREIHFTRKIILFETLLVLAAAPGAVVTKEFLVAKLWGDEYHPFQHDQRLYTCISRLRKLLELGPCGTMIRNEREGYSLCATVIYI